MRTRPHCLPLALAFSLAAPLLLAQDAAPPDPNAPAPVGQAPVATRMIEKEGVTLILLDVEVTDKHGRPMLGLTKNDFHLRLDTRAWPIYSVDDLCSCGAEEESGRRAAAESAPPASTSPALPAAGEAESRPPASGKVRYVLFFDFSQLQQEGRVRAIRAAERWVREMMKPGDEVMIAAYATKPGLEELTGFTDDKRILLDAIHSVDGNHDFLEVFPALFWPRIDECWDCVKSCNYGKCVPVPDISTCVECCPVCAANATEEFSQGTRALKALELFLTRLQDVPGRKVVLLLHQNNVPDPVRFYPFTPDDRPPLSDHLKLMDEVSATANASRAAIYPLQFTDPLSSKELLAQEAVTMGLNLALDTGGRYSRGLADLPAVMQASGRGCACIYRVGFKPPDPEKTEVMTAHVRVGRRTLSNTYKVIHLNEPDRLLRKAQSVLSSPSSPGDLGTIAALVPVAREKGRWTMKAEVVLDVDSLDLLPIAEGQAGKLDVGALLLDEKSEKTWEMLTGAEVHKGKGGGQGGSLVYANGLEGLHPGTYHLSVFARNRDLDVYGGGEARIDLPKEGEDAVVGPVVFEPGRRVFASDLPFKGAPAPVPPGVHVRAEIGSVPAGGAPARRGEKLEVESWLCGKEEKPESRFARYLARDGKPLFKFPPATTEPAGDCTRFTDEIDTAELSPGDYEYTYELDPTGGGEPLRGSLKFGVIEIPPRAASATAP